MNPLDFLEDLGERLQKVTALVNTALNGVQAAAQVANFALTGFSSTVQRIAGQIGGLVKLISPGQFLQYERAFTAFQAQLGEVFAPLLRGLGVIVQTVANALAGLTPQGRLFLIFLAGATAGLTAAITVGGIFIGIIAGVSTGLAAGAAALSAFGAALDAATGGLSGIGAVIGAVLGGIATVGSAAAGGLAAVGLATADLQKIVQDLQPALTELTAVFNGMAAEVLPQIVRVAKSLLPVVAQMVRAFIDVLPAVARVLAAFATAILPPLLKAMTALVVAATPLIDLLSRYATVMLTLGGALITVATFAVRAALALSPLINILRLITGGGRGAGAPGSANTPVTGASYTDIEAVFKRAQEQAVLGAAGQGDPIKDALKDGDVIDRWADKIGAAVAKHMGGGQAGGLAQDAINLATTVGPGPAWMIGRQLYRWLGGGGGNG